ncbi:hypothetical protein [Halalkalibacter oceani]|uniref:hypothetical protein n=1 Tax=Halalkalibacter oceani TaxID=1653776 RepID=UPI003397DE35
MAALSGVERSAPVGWRADVVLQIRMPSLVHRFLILAFVPSTRSPAYISLPFANLS